MQIDSTSGSHPISAHAAAPPPPPTVPSGDRDHDSDHGSSGTAGSAVSDDSGRGAVLNVKV